MDISTFSAPVIKLHDARPHESYSRGYPTSIADMTSAMSVEDHLICCQSVIGNREHSPNLLTRKTVQSNGEASVLSIANYLPRLSMRL